jgi:hypothetical protein
MRSASRCGREVERSGGRPRTALIASSSQIEKALRKELRPLTVRGMGSVLPLHLVALALVATGCDALDALEENPGRNPSTEPQPAIQLSCGMRQPKEDIIGMPGEQGTPVSVARDFLSRHGLRQGDRIVRLRGPWEPERVAVVVIRADRTVGTVELERENAGWLIRNLALCPEFAE